MACISMITVLILIIMIIDGIQRTATLTIIRLKIILIRMTSILAIRMTLILLLTVLQIPPLLLFIVIIRIYPTAIIIAFENNLQ
jgi:hypothetical protein